MHKAILLTKDSKLTVPTTAKEIKIYQDDRGFEPYIDWLDNLKDKRDQLRIRSRLRRVESGNLGVHKPIAGEGSNNLFELIFTFGPGYRVYFALDKDTIVLLLFGGDKSSQTSDIKKAKSFWKEYQDEQQA